MANSKGNWPTVPLGSIATIQSGGTPNRANPRYWDNGIIPWVTTSEVRCSTILDAAERITPEGLANSSATVFPSGTILIALYGQGKTRGQVGLLGIDAATNQACAAIIPGQRLERDYLYQYLKGAYKSIRALSNAGGQHNLSSQLIAEIPIPVPSKDEQLAFAVILRTWDDAIDKTYRVLESKENLLSLLEERLLVAPTLKLRSKRTKPEPANPLSTFTSELTERNGANLLGRDLVMGVSNANGIVPMRKQTIGSDLSRYKILPPKAFAYNPMRINVGSIAMSRLDSNVLISPDYVLFECIKDALDPDYFDHLCNTHWWKHHINESGSGSVRQRIYYQDLAALRVVIPSLDKQKRIARCLNEARREIELIETEIAVLNKQKRGLMQKLLTGQWRVNLQHDEPSKKPATASENTP